MRNLHRERIHFDTPWFIDVLADLIIDVDPPVDKRALRRFIMGELLVPMTEPQRSLVKRTTEIQANFDNADSIEEYFKGATTALLARVKKKGIEPDSIVDCVGYNDDYGNDMYEISFMSPETDTELAVRKRHVDIFNQILSNQDAIYAKIDLCLMEQVKAL